ncbi:MAG: TRAP transporter large permease subunit [Gemmatimonadetes bacterium]|nr:TRAP transporter large permease subunit [Gemmatimonadota bacterium]
MTEAMPLILFAVLFLLLLMGYPVAFTLGGVSVLLGLMTFGADFFNLLPLRIWGVMTNYVLLAVPLFVYMGVMLEKSGLAEDMLETMALLFGRLRGGLAVAVVVVGALLGASTGIVGATVVTMGLLSLPTMLRRGYSPPVATGTIAASGTLGQIIPPSVVLVLLGSILNVSVGDMFIGAVIPGAILVGMYLVWLAIVAVFKPEEAPAMPPEELAAFREKGMFRKIIRAFLLPLGLMTVVLGSIFAGVTSPTEAAAVGALGATLLTVFQGKFSYETLKSVMKECTHITCMVFFVLVGAEAFGLVFRGMKGDAFMTALILDANLSTYAFMALVLVMIFIAGFFIDFIQITYIIVPVVTPIFIVLGVDLLWLGILIAVNLQTSFLTPPFGFSLFYLKGVAPPEVQTRHIYSGILPFVVIQLICLGLLVYTPALATWLPSLR